MPKENLPSGKNLLINNPLEGGSVAMGRRERHKFSSSPRIFTDQLEEPFFALDANQFLASARRDVDDGRIFTAARRHGHDGGLDGGKFCAAIGGNEEVRLGRQPGGK